MDMSPLSQPLEVQKDLQSGRLLVLWELEDFEVEVGLLILVDFFVDLPFPLTAGPSAELAKDPGNHLTTC